MSETKSKYTKEIFGVAVFEAIKYLLILIVGFVMSLVSSSILGRLFSFLSPYYILISILFISLFTFVLIVIAQKVRKRRPVFQALDVDYHFVEWEITYNYHDANHMTYKRQHILKALRNGLQTFQDKYSWTGKGTIDIKSGIADHQLYQTFKKNIWQFYEIRFNKTLSKGEEIETEAIWELVDSELQSVPFFSATIHHPTDKLIMNLKLPSSLGITKVTREVSADIGVEKPYYSEEVTLDREGETRWEVKHPKLLHHYEIKWVEHSKGD